MRQGVIPNRFPDVGAQPEYNTADATLWMIQAMRAVVNASNDRTLPLNMFYPALQEVNAELIRAFVRQRFLHQLDLSGRAAGVLNEEQKKFKK